MPGTVIILWSVLGLGFIAMAAYAIVRERRRKAALRQLVDEMGLVFHDQLPSQDASVFANFTLANRGRSQRTRNAIVADSGDLRMVIFDFSYVTGGGKNNTTHRCTAALIQTPELDLPEFVLEPEKFLQRLAEFFGLVDIDFEDDPEFSKKFLLRGQDEEALRAFFTPERRRQLMQLQNTCLEGRGNSFLLYRSRGTIRPDRIKDLMKEVFEIHQLLASPQE